MAPGPRHDLQGLYAAHRDAVWNAALHLCGCASLAEDVAQDVFVGLLRARPVALRQPRAYLLRAVVHRVRDLARGRRPRADVAPEALPDAAPDAALLAIAGERTAVVAAALAALPLEQREVCVLHVFEGLPFRRIGELCGTSPDTAASRWRYACRRLRGLLADEGVET